MRFITPLFIVYFIKFIYFNFFYQGGLSYPILPCVGLVNHLKEAAKRLVVVTAKQSQQLKNFGSTSATFARKTLCFLTRRAGLSCTKMALLELLCTNLVPFL